MAEDWVPPGEFEEYRLVRLLGRGGMGSVWLAEDQLLHRMVAVKWIAHETPSARARQRFVVEARASARLQHVNVVTVHRYGELGGRPYLVSEYIRGESLDRVAKPVTWQRALEIGVPLARGLAAAHRHGIVHRDIKPANAILADDDEVKLVDFGLARLDDDKGTSTVSSTSSSPGASPRISGTPAYMPPEVRRGEPSTRRSDVYQVGCILYELVTGRPPLLDAGGITPTADMDAPSLTAAERQDVLAIPSLRGRLRDDGSSFADVVDRCLRIDPLDRFASGDELREALERLAGSTAPIDRIEGNPYRGLLPFEAEHRALFFGRAAETRDVCERLRSDPFVVVAGDSGTGKSSLCRAAVLPWIADGGLGRSRAWTIVRIVPGARPLTALIAALAVTLSVDESRLLGLADQPAGLVRELRRVARGGLVVFVDQLEEVVSLSGRAEAEKVAAVLAELAAGAPDVRLLATVRSDFLSRVAALPAIGPEITRALYLLGPLTVEGAREAIAGPARATGVTFETDALIDELVGAPLPLLSFTLAQLWDAHDRSTSSISARSLEAIGGVRGALARHADGVLERLLPDRRRAARRILMQLVAPTNTRARRTERELAGEGSVFAEALDALVRGRLVVARGAGEDTTYELAHEGLIDGWPTLAALISETEQTRIVLARLDAAVADWERLQRSRDALWSGRQLADVERVPESELTAVQAAFVRASRRAVRNRRWFRTSLVAAVPIVVVSLVVGARWIAARDRDARIAAKVVDAERTLTVARSAASEHATLRDRALAAFDRAELETGETDWTAALSRGVDARAAYAETSRALEAAFLLDTSRDDLRRRLADVLLERIALAERDNRDAERDDLESRLALYDSSGDLAARRSAPGEVDLAIDPRGAAVFVVDAGAPPAPLGPRARLAPGVHLLEVRADERAVVRFPVRVRAGESQRIAFTVPLATQVPAGYVYVPPGRFAYGCREDESIRHFYEAAPMHEVETAGFLIGVNEVTYADWVAFLDEQSDDERARRTPRISATASVMEAGELRLVRDADGRYELTFNPGGVVYHARAGEPIVYRDRSLRKSQDWTRFPVSGVSAEDASAYLAWLDRSGRVPHARLCTEREWEHAARGVDGRAYPNGREQLAADDANVDVTYGQREGGFGPDMVGSHPASTSVFGLADVSGNVLEMVQSGTSEMIALKGGGYYLHATDAHLANRQEIPRSFRHLHIGFRVCADAP